MRVRGREAALVAGMVVLISVAWLAAQEPTRPGRLDMRERNEWRNTVMAGRDARFSRTPGDAPPATYPWGGSFLMQSTEAFDTDGDGALSRQEYEAGMREVFDRLDANGDGKIDRDEMNRDLSGLFIPPATRARNILRLYDRNKDGKITADECLLPPKAFADLDLNKSGGLENDDLLKLTLTKALVLQDLGRRASALLAELDKDGDKKLSSEEFQLGKEVFQKADRNADGFLDMEELKLLPPLSVDHPQRRAEEMIARMDQDGDKMLAQNEFRLPGVRFEEADGNKDGLIDLKELVAWLETARGRQFGPSSGVEIAQRFLDRYDRNGDGKLTKDELKDVPETMWQRWDLNADGVVETAEIEKSFETMRERGGFGVGGRMMEAPGRAPRGEPLRGNPAKIIKARDQDGDGKLTAQELGVDERTFQRLDRDGDGKVTAEELATAQDLLRQRDPELRDKVRERVKPGKESKP